MRVIRAIRAAAIVLAMSFVTATAAFFTWFAWKWGAHYAGVWWRGVRERLDAGDTSINQASWWMRDRWGTLGGVLDGPKIDADSAPQMLAVIGAACVLMMVLRVPGSVLAGWLGRRAIRRDGVLCSPALARRLGRRVYVDGALRWSVPLGVAWGAGVALVNHVAFFSWLLVERESRLIAMALPVLVVPVLDVACSLRWARHLVSADVRGRQRMCRWCGYDVTSVGEGVCPECGRRVSAKDRDVGVRVVRPYAARVFACAAAFLLVVAAGIGWAIANVKGVSVLVDARRVVNALTLQRTEPAVRVWLPVGEVMEIRRGAERVLMRVEPPRVDETKEPERGVSPWFASAVRVVMRRGSEAPVRQRLPYGGNADHEEEKGVIAIGSSAGDKGVIQFTIVAPAVRDSSEQAYRFLYTECWLWLPRDAHVARLIEPGADDPDMAWLLADP